MPLPLLSGTTPSISFFQTTVVLNMAGGFVSESIQQMDEDEGNKIEVKAFLPSK